MGDRFNRHRSIVGSRSRRILRRGSHAKINADSPPLWVFEAEKLRKPFSRPRIKRKIDSSLLSTRLLLYQLQQINAAQFANELGRVEKNSR